MTTPRYPSPDLVEPDWAAVERDLDEAERTLFDPTEALPPYVSNIGRLATRVKQHDHNITRPDGSIDSFQTYHIDIDDPMGVKSVRIDDTIGNRIKTFDSVLHPTLPARDLIALTHATPEVHEAVRTWRKMDPANKREQLEDKMAKRDLHRAIIDAHSSGALDHDQAQILFNQAYDLKREHIQKQAGLRTAVAEHQADLDRTVPFSFDDYLDTTTFDDEQKDLLYSRFDLAEQLGWLLGNLNTKTNNSYADTVRILMDESTWRNIYERAGDVFKDHLESNPGHTNPDQKLVNRFLSFLKLEGDGGVDISDLDAIAAYLDDDDQWEDLRDLHVDQFAHFITRSRDAKIKGTVEDKIFSNPRQPNRQRHINNYYEKLALAYEKAIENGSVIAFDGTSFDSIAHELIKTVKPDDPEATNIAIMQGRTSPDAWLTRREKRQQRKLGKIPFKRVNRLAKRGAKHEIKKHESHHKHFKQQYKADLEDRLRTGRF